jgi:putative ABC transport system permease protein
MVKALDRKLLRDLSQMKGQLITIALVVACGITSYVTMRSAYDSLTYSRDLYYESTRFADVFAPLKQAPQAVLRNLETLDGVARVQTRIVKQVLVPMPNMDRPASGTIISRAPRGREGELNAIVIKQGRDLDPARENEVLVLERFAAAHKLELGDTLDAVLNGRLKTFSIVGFVLSPEYVMALAPGSLVYDPALVPVLWVNQTTLESAFEMAGAFNSVAATLEPGASASSVVAALNSTLREYGGFGAVARAKQQSNFMLDGELTQLRSMSGFVPYLFLFVAALLVNVVLSRLVQLQRSQIATLKAVGYSNAAIGTHYLKLVTLIVFGGALLGLTSGAWFGTKMVAMYTGEWFRFPNPQYRLAPSTAGFAIGVSFATALVGAWISARSVMKLPPADAMRPPAPPLFRRSFLERLLLWNQLGPAARMIWRELSRRPARVLLSSIGISMSVGILVVGRSMWDGIDYMMNVQLHGAMREDLNVIFAKAVSPHAARELGQMPGVFRAEGLRVVPVRFFVQHRFRDSAITGYPRDVSLRRLVNGDGSEFGPLPDRGVVLTAKLGELLGVGVGDTLTVELREGQWRTRDVTVSGLVEEPMGLSGHMDAAALAELMRDGGAVNSALLQVDTAQIKAIERRLKSVPWVVGVTSPRDFKRQFDEQSAAIIGVFTFVMTLFATIISVGVIYNNTRVALSQRSRELASLRVLGYTRREIAGILFGEQAIQVAIGIPIGLWFGRWMAQAMMANNDPEAYRLSAVVSGSTYAFAIFATIGAALLSGLIINRRIQTLDLIGVLKTRD